MKIQTNTMPLSFKDFSKQPVIGTMFLVIIGISALYIDIRSTFHEQIDNQGAKIEKLEEALDLPTLYAIINEASGIDLTGRSLLGADE